MLLLTDCLTLILDFRELKSLECVWVMDRESPTESRVRRTRACRDRGRADREGYTEKLDRGGKDTSVPKRKHFVALKHA